MAVLAAVPANGWRVAKWASRNMALVSVPVTDEPFCFAVNLETGAWSRFTGWNAEAIAVLGDSLHFSTGVDIFEADTGGQDNGSPFVCKMCGSFSTLTGPGFKAAKRVRGNFRANVTFTPKFSIATDYNTLFPTAPPTPRRQLPLMRAYGTPQLGTFRHGAATAAKSWDFPSGTLLRATDLPMRFRCKSQVRPKRKWTVN
jgi:hypothetical protein